jgi:hypothetical protein
VNGMPEPPWQRHLEDDENRQMEELFAEDDRRGLRDWLEALITSPAEHIDELRADPDLQVAVARLDMMARLLVWFTPDRERGIHRDGWEHVPERSGPVGDTTMSVEWSFTGTYEPLPNGEANTRFNGVLAVGQPVELRGVTLMGVEEVEGSLAFRLRRYVDWVGLYTQLGLSLNWRVTHEAGRRLRRQVS